MRAAINARPSATERALTNPPLPVTLFKSDRVATEKPTCRESQADGGSTALMWVDRCAASKEEEEEKKKNLGRARNLVRAFARHN